MLTVVTPTEYWLWGRTTPGSHLSLNHWMTSDGLSLIQGQPVTPNQRWRLSSQSLGLQLIFSKSLSLVPVPPETVFSAYTTSPSACFMCQIGHRGTSLPVFLISHQTSQVAPPLLSLASCTASNEILSPWLTTCSIFRDPSLCFDSVLFP